MKLSRLFTLPLIIAGLYCGQLLAEEYNIDDEGAHAFVQFKANHLGYSYVIGRFNNFDGTFTYDPENPAAAKVSVTIETESIDSNHAERDKHLRSGDFFDVDTYPEITFNSTSFSESDDGSVSIVGDLNMMGKTKSITIEGRHIGHGDDPWGGYRRGLEGTLNLDATEFGFPKWVGDVEIYLVTEGIRS